MTVHRLNEIAVSDPAKRTPVGSTVPTIVPVTRQKCARKANTSQLARSVKWKRVKDLGGKKKMSERRISV